MHIQVSNLQGRPRRFTFREAVDDFPALVALAEQGDVIFKGDILADLEVSRVDGVIRVTGQVAADVTMPCSRCLDPLEQHLDLPVTLCYSEVESTETTAGGDEIDLSLEDLELIPFGGDEIDLGLEIAQELIMALPQAVLCGENCAGLCPVCGTNLNKNTCRCEPPVFHEGLARLKDFKAKRD